jgi:hypothetical protein
MITLIIGATEKISKSLIDVPREHEIKEQQKQHIVLQKVLMKKYKHIPRAK